MRWTVEDLRLGTARPFGPKGQPSAIAKQSVQGPVRLTSTGFVGDQQGDPKHHGGVDKAAHIYAADHFDAWAHDLPHLADILQPGAFGENLVVRGLTEAGVCMADRFRLGTALVEVSQGRQPCWKLNVRFGQPDMAKRVQATGRTGWYFRVIEEGEVCQGGTLELIERPNETWPLSRINQLLYKNMLDLEALTEFAALPGLPPSWRLLAQARIARGEVEDWSRRLKTP